ncbi:hypothetical protein SAMN05216376_105251 [Mameliella alba]|uniref:DUF1178 family protein n=1 Tax=Mameliella alba TaxID=561184 RepID=UPI00087E81C7|nr:DUF1178 family protein [Mameliella alba]OWV48295.1 hypothetical protein CDZ96_10810 [Mameliella alba]PTR40341.1 hypothetical protein LX94_01824 [Mameliella alba]GGF44213.1 hypothetical protein GCM10011319_02520 [Mameliella alba]SDC99912.1 hypothetical protein SAMN05216376_105251 [Mameliella alba]
MIQYSLKCADGHQFDSWFQSASAFDKLQAAGHVACAVCGSEKVEKALMAPRVGHGDKPEPAPEKPLSKPANPAEQALAALKAHVEANSDYVGTRFAQEARAMHAGDAPERPIWGEAKGHEAKALIEDGIKVAPLPFTPTRKSN